jgi:hypothetical protein
MSRFWLADYSPEIIAIERRRFAPLARIQALIGGASTVTEVAVPADCSDGFGEAYYGRPERFLDPAARAAQSGWGFVEPAATKRALAQLRRDLDSGTWDARHGAPRTQPEYDGSPRIITAWPG